MTPARYAAPPQLHALEFHVVVACPAGLPNVAFDAAIRNALISAMPPGSGVGAVHVVLPQPDTTAHATQATTRPRVSP